MTHQRAVGSLRVLLLSSVVGCSPAIETASKVVPVAPDPSTALPDGGERPKSTGVQVKIPMH